MRRSCMVKANKMVRVGVPETWYPKIPDCTITGGVGVRGNGGRRVRIVGNLGKERNTRTRGRED